MLPAVAGLVGTLRIHAKRLAQGVSTGFALATDLAELLARRGVPFREAHEVMGHLGVWCQVHDCDLPEVSVLSRACWRSAWWGGREPAAPPG